MARRNASMTAMIRDIDIHLRVQLSDSNAMLIVVVQVLMICTAGLRRCTNKCVQYVPKCTQVQCH
jgi:uncharacterized membrane protein YjgN (DUF898 family)